MTHAELVERVIERWLAFVSDLDFEALPATSAQFRTAVEEAFLSGATAVLLQIEQTQTVQLRLDR